MKPLIKLTALLLSLTILSGCGQNQIGEKQAFNPNITEEVAQPRSQKEEKAELLKIACNYDKLVASPWNCPDLNTRKSASLLYDSPVRLGTDFKAEPFLVDISGGQALWTLTPKPGIKFTDGSELTAQDINNSLAMALAEGSFYRNRLVNIASYKVVGESVQITLLQPDALFANLLTFPVAKATENGYIGTGRYQYSFREGSSVFLEKNPSHPGPASGIEKIELKDLHKKGVASYSLKLGEIDCLYTEENRSDLTTVSTSDYPAVKNQLVFLGLNAGRGPTVNPLLRKILNLALDREALVQAALSSSAVPAENPLHPNFYPQNKELMKGRTPDITRKSLLDSGFMTEEKPLSLKLLYCSDNQDRAQTANQVSAQLTEAGIEVILDPRPEAEYFALLEAGNYDLYLGEVLLGDDMDLSHILMRGERYGYGTGISEKLLNSYRTAFASGQGWDVFLTDFREESPVIPLAFRNGTLSFTREHSFLVTSTANDLFYNIDQWQ